MPVQLPAAPLLIQLPANGLGKATEDCPSADNCFTEVYLILILIVPILKIAQEQPFFFFF